jgi:hypothetical protein
LGLLYGPIALDKAVRQGGWQALEDQKKQKDEEALHGRRI